MEQCMFMDAPHWNQSCIKLNMYFFFFIFVNFKTVYKPVYTIGQIIAVSYLLVR